MCGKEKLSISMLLLLPLNLSGTSALTSVILREEVKNIFTQSEFLNMLGPPVKSLLMR